MLAGFKHIHEAVWAGLSTYICASWSTSVAEAIVAFCFSPTHKKIEY